MKAKIAKRRQIKIPKLLRKKLGVQDPVIKSYGCLKSKKSSNALLKELRGNPRVPQDNSNILKKPSLQNRSKN